MTKMNLKEKKRRYSRWPGFSSLVPEKREVWVGKNFFKSASYLGKGARSENCRRFKPKNGAERNTLSGLPKKSLVK